MLDLPLENLFRPAKKGGGNSPSIFFLHGFGSNMQDLFGLSPYFPENWNCISLQGTLPVYQNGWAWAELNFNDILKIYRPDQYLYHYEKILQSINLSVEQLKLDSSQIYLLGFSQGAGLSIYTGLKNPTLFKGIIALSGCISVNDFESELNLENIKSLKIFMGNGIQDEMIPIAFAQKTKDQLIELDVKVDYNEYNATHTIANDCLNDFMSWIKPLSQQ